MVGRALSALGTCIVAALLAGSAGSVEVAGAVNLDFEDGELGAVPPGWRVAPSSLQAGFTAKLTGDGAHAGSRCVELGHDSSEMVGLGSFMQELDATPWRGKAIRFRAWARVERAGARQASVFAVCDLPGGALSALSKTVKPEVRETEWTRYEVVGMVEPDATKVRFGMSWLGGKAWLDDASLEIVDAREVLPEGPSELTDRGLENLVAFARLYGFVRWFHPSDQAVAADWNAVAIEGVRVVESAADADALAASLVRVFGPLAPALRVYPTAGPPADLPAFEPPPGMAPARVVAWRHLGMGQGRGAGPYTSRVVDPTQPWRAEEAHLTSEVDATALRGRKVRLTMATRLEAGHQGHARVSLVAYGPGGISLREQEDVVSDAWSTTTVEGTVLPDALGVVCGVDLGGEGRVLAASPLLTTLAPTDQPAGAGTSAALKFDPGATVGRGYAARQVPGLGPDGAPCVVLESVAVPPEGFPDPRVPLVADLPGGVTCRLPLALFVGPTGTLPSAPTPAPSPLRPLRTGDDRATRLADVIIAWNVFEHFYPYFDVVGTDWPAVLPRTLKEAASDGDAREFHDTLRRLVADLHDGHGRVGFPADMGWFTLPIAWDWVEGHVVVTRVGDSLASELRVGDVVLSVNGRAMDSALRDEEELISAATPAWARWRALGELLRGTKDEAVRLEVRTGDATPREVTLTRSMAPRAALEDERPEKVTEIRPGIMYVDVGRAKDEDVVAAMDRLAAAKGLVFDLRGYPAGSTLILSHLTSTPVTCARWNVPVVRWPDRKAMELDFSNWTVSPAEPRFRGKATFLTDGRAISYAETYLGIVEAYGLADIVGSPTAGTNGNVNPFELPGGYAVSWTGMKVLKHDGSRHHGVGIQPTVPVARTVAGIAAGRDEVLERAIELVSQ